MWLRKTVGLALAAAGLAVLIALLYPYFTRSLETGSIFQSSIPVALLTGMAALIAFVLGAHLMLPGGLHRALRRRERQ
jgi:hypothetical protein